jgi:hypothetical protein
MKSLEIVNKKINYCEEQEVPCVSMRLVSLQQIKQDLEILKIILEKKVDVSYLTHALVSYDSLEDVLNCYNCSMPCYQLTMEELLNLKQWLEENEL